MKNRHHHHHLLATYAKSRDLTPSLRKFPLELSNIGQPRETRMMRLSRWEKVLMISLAVWIQYTVYTVWRTLGWTRRQTDTDQPRPTAIPRFCKTSRGKKHTMQMAIAIDCSVQSRIRVNFVGRIFSIRRWLQLRLRLDLGSTEIR